MALVDRRRKNWENGRFVGQGRRLGWRRGRQKQTDCLFDFKVEIWDNNCFDSLADGLNGNPVKQCVVPSMQIYPSSVHVQGSAICIDVITALQLRTEMIASIEPS